MEKDKISIFELRKQTSLVLEGNLLKAIIISLFSTLISGLAEFGLFKLSGFLPNHSNIFYIIQLLVSVILLPLSYGVIVSMIRISKNENVTITDFINIAIMNYSKVIKIIFNIFIRIIGYVFLFTIFLFLLAFSKQNDALVLLFSLLTIASFIILIYKAMNYCLAFFINYENPNKPCKEILKESSLLMKKNKLRFILIVLSFILYFIIIGLISKISRLLINEEINNVLLKFLFALILPSITICQYLFYESLKSNK